MKRFIFLGAAGCCAQYQNLSREDVLDGLRKYSFENRHGLHEPIGKLTPDWVNSKHLMVPSWEKAREQLEVFFNPIAEMQDHRSGLLIQTRPDDAVLSFVGYIAEKMKYVVSHVSALEKNEPIELIDLSQRMFKFTIKPTEMHHVVIVHDLEKAVLKGRSIAWLRKFKKVIAIAGSDVEDADARMFFGRFIKLPASTSEDAAHLANESYEHFFRDKKTVSDDLIESTRTKVLEAVKSICAGDRCPLGDAGSAFRTAVAMTDYQVNQSFSQEKWAELIVENVRSEFNSVVSRLRSWQRSAKKRGDNYASPTAGAPVITNDSMFDSLANIPALVWGILFFAVFAYYTINTQKKSLEMSRRRLGSNPFPVGGLAGGAGLPGAGNMYEGMGPEIDAMPEGDQKKEWQQQMARLRAAAKANLRPGRQGGASSAAE